MKLVEDRKGDYDSAFSKAFSSLHLIILTPVLGASRKPVPFRQVIHHLDLLYLTSRN
jgi:hypothetical protein